MAAGVLTELRRTACPLDCPDACSLQAEVDGDRLVSLAADHRNPLTEGLICGKVRRFDRHLQSAERVLYPQRRVGARGEGGWQRITWDQALDEIVESIGRARQRYGAQSVLPLSYGGSNGALTHECVDTRFFRRLGASNLDRTVCAAPSSAAATGLYGRMPGVALEDYRHAKLIVAWGVNPHASGIHHVPVIKAAKAAGATLVVVDPRSTPLAKLADLHLAVRPGTDLPLAMAVIAWLFEHGHADQEFLAEHCTGASQLQRRAQPWTLSRAAAECQVPTADIERLAQLWADSNPAVVRCGWGLERNRNGGSAAAAVLALPAVAGKFGVRGGGYTASNSKAHRIDTSAAINAEAPDVRTINMNRLGRALTEDLDPPIAVLMTYCCNPLATLPNRPLVAQGMARDDLFHVVHEQVMTDTARVADIVLPATTFLEHDDLTHGYGAMVVNRVRAVMPPVGESRPNYDVFAALCQRLSLARPDDAIGADALVQAIIDGSDDPLRLASELAERDLAEPTCGYQPVTMVDVMPRTTDGKIHLFPEALDREAPQGLYGYRADPGTAEHPLALISPASAKTTNSTFGQLDHRPAEVAIHPDDAKARGINGGDRVRIDSAYGQIVCHARVSTEVRPGVASLAKGLWSHRVGGDGSTTNAVAPDTLSDLGDGATFNDARVEIVAL